MFKKCIGFLWLEGIWLLLWQSVSVLTIVGGFVSIIIIFLVFRSPDVELNIKIKPWSVCKIIVLFLFYLVQSSLLVAWYAIRPQKPPVSDVFRIERSLDSELISVFLYDFIILIPGTIIVEIENNSSILHIHSLNGAKKLAFYQQYYAMEKLFHQTFLSHLPYTGPQLSKEFRHQKA